MLNNQRYKKIHKIKKKYIYNLESNFKINITSSIQMANPKNIVGNQIEAVRRVITKKTERFCQIKMDFKPNIPITSKASGVRMGKGKGKFKILILRSNIGQMLFKVYCLNPNLKKILISAKKKLSGKYYII
jgi:large subunit ribosomal protein L16